MKISSAIALLALLVPAAVACTSASTDDGSESGSSEVIAKPDEDAGDRKDDGGGTTTACAQAGGSCVGLSPTSCKDGTWGNANEYSCGGGIGVGCCLPAPKCPDIVRPAPSFCPDGKVVLEKDENGCDHYTCLEPVRPTNKCVAAGGECVGLSPASCEGGTWGDATTYPCGGGLGTGCCFR